MNIKAFDAGPIESGAAPPQRKSVVLAPGQQRVLELQDGDSFVLQTIPIAEGDGVHPKWRTHDASHIAARLASWARRRHVRLAYRMIDKATVRIWRLRAI